MAPRPRPSTRKRLRTFLRTPKGTLLWVLLVLGFLASLDTPHQTVVVTLTAVSTAMLVDLGFEVTVRDRWAFPSGAILTGLILALVLAPTTSVAVTVLTAMLAIVLKHVVRTSWSNVFNPAVLALVITAPIFKTTQSWWGTIPDLPVVGFLVVLGAGYYVASKVNKLPLAASYLLTSLSIFSVAAFAGAATHVVQIFRAPDINAMVFFACFMLDDPPTSPAHHQDQIWFGTLAGAAGAVIFLLTGVQWFLMAGLPLANACESIRRVFVARRKRGTRRQVAVD